jgi:methionine-gamma-lyase
MPLHSSSQYFDSICVKDPIIDGHAAHVPPIYATSTFTYDDLEAAFDFFRGKSDKFTYSRLGNPSTAFVAQKIAALESCGWLEDNGQPFQARGLLFASGMAAISTALLSKLKAGDTVLTQGNLYGTTNELLTKELASLGIRTKYTDFKQLSEVQACLTQDKSIQVLYIETPANPTLACYDLAGLCALAQLAGVTSIVDNTFSTSYLQQPLRFGADIVVYSTTKFMNGHGTGISGAAVCRSADDHKAMFRVMKNYGSNASPFEAYLLNNGLKTLSMRMERHQQNAQALAEMLEDHPAVSTVNYLGLNGHADHALAQAQMRGPGGMLSFELKGGLNAGMAFQKAIRFCTLTASLGTADTLITHPASTSHVNVPSEQRLSYGITDGLVRVSVGLEDLRDIMDDFSGALSACN